MNRKEFIGHTLKGATGLFLIKNPLNLSQAYGKDDKEIRFNNNASQVGFIGHYNSVEELIAADTKELERIGGSFKEIADRIKEILEYAENEANGKPNKNSIDPIIISFYSFTFGGQDCPFEGCNEGWNDFVRIKNSETEKTLTINRGIEHLARDHHLLEKGNEYEIIPERFYEHFMPHG